MVKIFLKCNINQCLTLVNMILFFFNVEKQLSTSTMVLKTGPVKIGTDQECCFGGPKIILNATNLTF